MNLFSQYKGLRRENYILFLGRMVTNMGSMIWPVLTLVLNQKLGMSATGISIFSICAGVVVLPVGIIGGKLADRYNKKNIIVIADAISIIFFIVSALIPLSMTTMILLVIGSAFQQLEQPAYIALIADITTTKDRERAYSLSYLGANLGLVASPTIAGLLMKNYLWLSFIISGLAIGCSTILILLFVKDITPIQKEDEADEYQQGDETASVWRILKNNKLIMLYILVMGIFWAAYSQWGYLMPLDLGRVHGDNGAVIYGTITSINCIVVVVCTPFLTRLFENVTKTVQTFIGNLFLLTGFVVFLLFVGHIPFYYVAIFLFTLGEILVTIVSSAYISERIPASHRGRINGVQTFLQSLLYGGVMLLTGVIYDNSGYVSAWIFTFGLLGFVAVGTLYMIFRDKKVYPMLYK